MRCPYCGGLNQERAVFCVNCGRDLRRAQPDGQQQQRPSAPAPQQPGYPTNQPAYRESGAPSQPQRSPTQTGTPAGRRQPVTANRAPVIASLVPPPPPPEPEAPGPFPPRTLAQFEALLSAEHPAYTVLTSKMENSKKILYIAYPRCGNWQQAATLLQALKENQEGQYTTMVVRGVFSHQQDLYEFTNGQLQFDRNVRLGAQVGKRYVVETGNGYAADSVRFVLNE